MQTNEKKTQETAVLFSSTQLSKIRIKFQFLQDTTTHEFAGHSTEDDGRNGYHFDKTKQWKKQKSSRSSLTRQAIKLSKHHKALSAISG